MPTEKGVSENKQSLGNRDKKEFFQRGFNLMEILIILAIIGLLMGIALVGAWSARDKAKAARARKEMRQIYNAVMLMEADTEMWPGHQVPYEIGTGAAGNEICGDGCAFGLNDCMAGLVCNPELPDSYMGWDGPYMNEMPKDPWGNDYFFDTDYDLEPGEGEKWAVVIGSYGPNGQGNNQYDEDDVLQVIISE